VLQTQDFDQVNEQPVWVVLQQIIGIRIAVHINADLVCHDVVSSYCELFAWSNADFACSYNYRSTAGEFIRGNAF
jgi:hypothetical protein